MDTASAEIAKFWNLFRQRAADLAASGSADSPAFDELLGHLHRIDPGLYLEFCVNTGDCELIVTADGDRSLFSLSRAVVVAAPMIEGWTIRALKPQIGCPETTQCEGLTLRLADITFDPLEREGTSELGLRIFVPGIEEKDIDAAHNALLRALDHILGEEKFAEAVQYIEVLPLPENVAREQFISISDLDAFIRWRQGGRQAG
jgi:hypothetical protein